MLLVPVELPGQGLFVTVVGDVEHLVDQPDVAWPPGLQFEMQLNWATWRHGRIEMLRVETVRRSLANAAFDVRETLRKAGAVMVFVIATCRAHFEAYMVQMVD